MKIKKIFSPTEDDLTRLNRKFEDFLSSRFSNLAPECEDKKFLFSAFDGSKFIGGISGSVYWDGLEIDTLWVKDDYRGQGIGARLLVEAEDYARDNAAVIAFLNTVDATEFYEKFGYRVYGQLEDRPVGTVLFHMKKRLDEKESS